MSPARCWITALSRCGAAGPELYLGASRELAPSDIKNASTLEKETNPLTINNQVEIWSYSLLSKVVARNEDDRRPVVAYSAQELRRSLEEPSR